MNFIEIWVTCPSIDVAERIADKLVGSRLAACVNILGKVRSVYRWQGRIERESEVPLVIKTRAAFFDAVAAQVATNHPYDTPAIVAVPVLQANKAYSDWLIDCTEPDDQSPAANVLCSVALERNARTGTRRRSRDNHRRHGR